MTPPAAALDPLTHTPHRLHGESRLWPLSNCYIDLWIELLSALGMAPEAMLGFTLEIDFEGDQFTFLKPPTEDLAELYGIRIQELAVYDRIEQHLDVQAGRGRICLVEVDGYFLPDTVGLGYGKTHGKTTIAVLRIDRDARSLDYLHNGGCHRLAGEDFDGLFRGYAHGEFPFLPYAELVKLPPGPVQSEPGLRKTALAILARRLALRPSANPIGAFQAGLCDAARDVADRGGDHFHLYAFNTLRQLGAAFDLLADHLIWLDDDLGSAADAAREIAQSAKAVQFQLARACARRRFDALDGVMNAAAVAYDRLIGDLETRLAISPARSPS